jgi:hypothetical protein
MRDIPWATPEVIDRMTMTDIACLSSEKEEGKSSGSLEAFQSYLQRRAVEEQEWSAKTKRIPKS